MAYAYKLLSQKMTSRNNTKWEIGKAIEISKEFSGNELCSNQLLHCYASPEIAVVMNPIHANISEPRLFRIRCSKILADDGTKQGCKKQTLLKELPLPEISVEQRIKIAILCATEVYKEPNFLVWAENWNTGKDRTATSANAAANAANAAAYAAYAAYAAAAYAAYNAAAYAAYAAAYNAAKAASYAADKFSLQAIIETVVKS